VRHLTRMMFTWAAGPAADVSALRYADDGHGSGRLCLKACGVAPECRFEYDYAYAGPAFATLPPVRITPPNPPRDPTIHVHDPTEATYLAFCPAVREFALSVGLAPR
jgi:hypothetical protein